MGSSPHMERTARTATAGGARTSVSNSVRTFTRVQRVLLFFTDEALGKEEPGRRHTCNGARLPTHPTQLTQLTGEELVRSLLVAQHDVVGARHNRRLECISLLARAKAIKVRLARLGQGDGFGYRVN